MRIIEAFDRPIRNLALSPDGRFVAAVTDETQFAVFSLATGDRSSKVMTIGNGGQLAFTADGTVLVIASRKSGVYAIAHAPSPDPSRIGIVISNGPAAGGLAIAPDGKTLAVACDGRKGQVKLQRWSVPSWRSLTGFDFWSPFTRLAYSPNGEFIGGINANLFELRIAVTGGLNGRQVDRGTSKAAFLSFSRESDTVAFGWDEVFYIMETRAGNVLKEVPSPGERLIDAVYFGSSHHLATIDGTRVMRVWSAETGKVINEYDWGLGGLTCIAAASDGLTGICGTNTGRLIAFDVDE